MVHDNENLLKIGPAEKNCVFIPKYFFLIEKQL